MTGFVERWSTFALARDSKKKSKNNNNNSSERTMPPMNEESPGHSLAMRAEVIQRWMAFIAGTGAGGGNAGDGGGGSRAEEGEKGQKDNGSGGGGGYLARGAAAVEGHDGLGRAHHAVVSAGAGGDIGRDGGDSTPLPDGPAPVGDSGAGAGSGAGAAGTDRVHSQQPPLVQVPRSAQLSSPTTALFKATEMAKGPFVENFAGGAAFSGGGGGARVGAGAGAGAGTTGGAAWGTTEVRARPRLSVEQIRVYLASPTCTADLLAKGVEEIKRLFAGWVEPGACVESEVGSSSESWRHGDGC